MKNPLLDAIHVYADVVETQGDLMHAVGGCAAFEPFDQVLCDEVWDLTVKTWGAVSDLSERAAEARINLIWRDFIKNKPKRENPCSGLPSNCTAPSPEKSLPCEPSISPTTEQAAPTPETTMLS